MAHWVVVCFSICLILLTIYIFIPVSSCRRGPSTLLCPGSHNAVKMALVTLNPSKCEFNKESVKFLGHLLDKNGTCIDPSKTEAVLNMEAPQSVTGLRRFPGMVNQLGKFSPCIPDLGQPLRELLSPKNLGYAGQARTGRLQCQGRAYSSHCTGFIWSTCQDKSFSRCIDLWVRGSSLTTEHINKRMEIYCICFVVTDRQREKSHWLTHLYLTSLGRWSVHTCLNSRKKYYLLIVD